MGGWIQGGGPHPSRSNCWWMSEAVSWKGNPVLWSKWRVTSVPLCVGKGDEVRPVVPLEADLGCAPFLSIGGAGSVSLPLRSGPQGPFRCLLTGFRSCYVFNDSLSWKINFGNSLKENLQKEQMNEQRLGTFPLSAIKVISTTRQISRSNVKYGFPLRSEDSTVRLHIGAC